MDKRRFNTGRNSKNSRPPLQKTLPPKNLWLEPPPPRTRSVRKSFPTLRRASLFAKKFWGKRGLFDCGGRGGSRTHVDSFCRGMPYYLATRPCTQFNHFAGV